MLLPVVADDAVELLHDAGGELGVGALQVTLEVFVLAFELEAPVLEVLLEVVALLLTEHERLLVVVLLHAVEVLTLVAQRLLRMLELRLHLILRFLAGVAVVQRALHVHDGDLQLGAGHPRGSRRDDHHGDQESDPSPRLCLTSHPPLVHGPPLSSKSQYWNGPPNENSSKLF